ncbi:MAG: MFS transporter [Anaerolineales bacterium]
MRDNKAILIAYLSYMALGAFDGLLGVVWPAMSLDFGVPLGALGILGLISLAGFVLVSFNSGPLIRAKSFHWLLLAGLGIRAAAFMVIALFPSWPVILVMTFLLALGGGGIDSGLNIFIAARGNARQINWLHASFGIGATSGPFLAAGVQAAGGTWQWNFAVIAAFLAVLTFLVWRTASHWRMEIPLKEEQRPAAKRQAKLVDSLRLPVVQISVMLFFFYVATEISTGQWSFSLFTLGRGTPELAAKFWVGAYWGVFTIGRILFGLVADKVPLNTFLRGALVAATAGALLLWWNPVAWVGFAGLALMGLAEAPIYPSLIASTTARVGRENAANAIGLQGAAAGVGGATMVGLIGILATSIGIEMIAVSIVILAFLTLLFHEILLIAAARRRPQAA